MIPNLTINILLKIPFISNRPSFVTIIDISGSSNQSVADCSCWRVVRQIDSSQAFRMFCYESPLNNNIMIIQSDIIVVL